MTLNATPPSNSLLSFEDLPHISHISQKKQGLHPFPDKLYVVTVISNPCRYLTRYNLYRAFEKMVADGGAILYTVEMAFGGRPFEVTSPNNPQHIQVRGSAELWHKENLLNIGISRLPANAKYMATCFTGDNLVETIDGLKRIDEVKEGELVKTHLGRYRKIIRLSKTPYKPGSPLLNIKTLNSEIKCTPEHPFYIFRNGEKQWVKSSDLNENDTLLYPDENKKDFLEFNIKYNKSNDNFVGRYKGSGKGNAILETLEVNEEIAEFLGLYLAEGSTNQKSGIRFTFNNNEKDLHDLISKVSFNLFKRKIGKNVRWATNLSLNIKHLCPLFSKWFGTNARNKRIPDFVFSWNLKNKVAFIVGLLKGDGRKNKKTKNNLCFQSIEVASEQMMIDLRKLLSGTGLLFNDKIIRTDFHSAFSKNPQISYRLNISTQSSNKLIDLYKSIRLDDEYLSIPIESITNKKMYRANYENGNYVYNIEVEEDHTYIVASVIVHNCDADISFVRPDWAQETIQQLQHYQVVQMFSHASDIGPNYQPINSALSWTESIRQGLSFKGTKKEVIDGSSLSITGSGVKGAWHSGLAWAYRREALDKMGGLIDWAILGSGDRNIISGLFGHIQDTIDPTFSPQYKQWMLNWQDRAVRNIRKNVGQVDGLVYHYWHGPKVNRKYTERWKILSKYQFNPEIDIKKDAQGIWVLEDFQDERSIGLKNALRNYFKSRDEDSTSLT